MRQRVLVLLSTYNGERYISHQIDSILAQENVDVSILVRDDGSTDNTKIILKDYCSKHHNVSLMEGNENLRPGNSFMRLLYWAGEDEYDKYDYYAFADQDDIWLKCKLIKSIEIIEANTNTDEAVLYCSNQIIYKNESRCGLRFANPPKIDLASVISSNKVSGCTFVMNRKLMREICNAAPPSEALMLRRMHDVWIALAAICLGKVIYDEKSYILYRIHDNNAVGIKKKSALQQFKIYRKNLVDKAYGNYRSWTAREALNAFPTVQGRNREILEELSDYRINPGIKRKLLSDYDILKRMGNNILVTKIKIILNIL